MEIKTLEVEAVNRYNETYWEGLNKARVVSASKVSKGDVRGGSSSTSQRHIAKDRRAGSLATPELSTVRETAGSSVEASSIGTNNQTDSKLVRGQTPKPASADESSKNRSKQTRTTMLKGLLAKNKSASVAEGPNLSSGGTSAGAGLKGLLFMKKKVSTWRASKLRAWSMVGGHVHGAGTTVSSQISVKTENSYRMEPENNGRFVPAHVRQAAERAMERILGPQQRYDANKGGLLSRLVSDEIKSEIKKLGYGRYKIVVHVMVGQDKDQGVTVSSRAVWDTGNDNSATAVFRSGDLFAVANVFATYFE